MSITRVIIIIVGIYLAYRFIFDFAIPIYRASRKIHRQFRNMQSMQNQMNETGAPNAKPYPENPGTKVNTRAAANTHSKDYIDFEEVK